MTKTTSPSFLERNGATPGKLALIAVLGVVLAYVIISQLPSRNPTVSTRSKKVPVATASRTPGAKPSKTGANSGAASEIIAAKPWPAVELATVTAHDPFAIPAWARASNTLATNQATNNTPAATITRKKSLDKLLASGTTMVMIVDGQPLALVGDRQVRVGDELEGFKVTAITESGIVLSGKGESE